MSIGAGRRQTPNREVEASGKRTVWLNQCLTTRAPYKGWGEGSLRENRLRRTPHPSSRVAAPNSPLPQGPQGERAQAATALQPPMLDGSTLQELLRDLRPLVPAAIVQRLFSVLCPVVSVLRAQAPNPRMRCLDPVVPSLDQKPLDRPHVLGREPPIIRSQPAQIDQRVSLDAAGGVDIRIEVAHDERADRAEHRLSPVQTRVARPRHRAPAAALPVYEDDVVEPVFRFEAHDQRRITVLLQDASRRQRRFDALGRAMPKHLTQTSQRVADGRRLGVVWQPVEKALHQVRRAQPLDQAPLGWSEGVERGSRNHGAVQTREPSYSAASNAGCFMVVGSTGAAPGQVEGLMSKTTLSGARNLISVCACGGMSSSVVMFGAPSASRCLVQASRSSTTRPT